jgi:hypothetical protein
MAPDNQMQQQAMSLLLAFELHHSYQLLLPYFVCIGPSNKS